MMKPTVSETLAAAPPEADAEPATAEAVGVDELAGGVAAVGEAEVLEQAATTSAAAATATTSFVARGIRAFRRVDLDI
jgi:hypothetical protein